MTLARVLVRSGALPILLGLLAGAAVAQEVLAEVGADGSSLTLTVPTKAGHVYEIERSTDLGTWRTQRFFLAPTDGTRAVEVPADAPDLFYRVRDLGPDLARFRLLLRDNGDGTLTLGWRVQANFYQYKIERSTDLVNWTPYDDEGNLTGAAGTFVWGQEPGEPVPDYFTLVVPADTDDLFYRVSDLGPFIPPPPPVPFSLPESDNGQKETIGAPPPDPGV